jgi:hypothetical protein
MEETKKTNPADLNGDGKVTFAANQYYGDLSDNEETLYNTYFAGCDSSWFDGV